MKKQLVAQIVAQLKSYGYTVYVSSDKEHGCYTDGERMVSFGSSSMFSLNFYGNYFSTNCGTGWSAAWEVTCVSKEDAEKYVKALAPTWATQGESVLYPTPEEYLKSYPASGYTIVE